MTPDDDGDPCPHCGGEGYIDDSLSSACGGRWFRYCDCPVGEAASEEDRVARGAKLKDSMVSNLEERLNRAMPEALALIMFDDLKQQFDVRCTGWNSWLDAERGLTDVVIDGKIDLVSMAQAVLNALKSPDIYAEARINDTPITEFAPSPKREEPL